jgi:hypothetical protein
MPYKKKPSKKYESPIQPFRPIPSPLQMPKGMFMPGEEITGQIRLRVPGSPGNWPPPAADGANLRPGMRIVLIETTDIYTRLQPGDKGTIERTRQAPSIFQVPGKMEWEVDVKWDDGSHLTMILPRDKLAVDEP